MPLAAVVGAALTTPGSRVWSLFVDSLEVSKEPATPARWGVIWQSVQLHVGGAGSTSSLSFDIDDPTRVLAPTEGMEVRLFRMGRTNVGNGTDLPWFVGTMELVTSEYDGVTRVWHCRATGIDALPDWCTLDVDLTFANGATPLSMVQTIVANCSNTGGLRALGYFADQLGTTAAPTANINGSLANGPITIKAGTSMRRAVEQAVSLCVDGVTLKAWRFHVDMYRGVHLFAVDPNAQYAGPDGITFIIQPAGNTGSDSRFSRDGTTAIRQATFIGAAGVRGSTSDGSGLRGRSAVITDTTLTTVGQCQAAAAAYIAAHRTSVRGEIGSVDIAEVSVPFLEAASVLWATQIDEGFGLILGGLAQEVGALDVTFNAGAAPSARWSYGGQETSAAILLRRWAGQPLAS